MKRVLIGGVGNVLLGDDGVGPYVVHHLESEYEFGPEVEIVDLGTPALDLIYKISGLDALILIDSVKNDEAPGTITLYRKEDLTRHAPAMRLDPHSPALTESLFAADMLGSSPADVLLVGVTGESYDPGCALSPDVSKSVERVLRAIVEELDGLGIQVRQKSHHSDPGIWWEGTTASAIA